MLNVQLKFILPLFQTMRFTMKTKFLQAILPHCVKSYLNALTIAACSLFLSFNAFAEGMMSLIPKPVSSKSFDGHFLLDENTKIYVASADPEVEQVAQQFAQKLRPATGYLLKVKKSLEQPNQNYFVFKINPNMHYGDEGYILDITNLGAQLTAKTAEGLFRGTQTLRQMLNHKIEANSKQKAKWQLTQGHIIDYPRMAYRGFMLDSARYFYSVEEVKAILDQMALYKMNVFHFHLTDDQGWRIEIPKWPKLTEIGSRSAVNQTDCEGCFYTLADFDEIVKYAEQRFIQVVPEIDTPGHTRAAMASYKEELYCDGDAPDWPFITMDVKISSLCFSNPIIYKFFDDVIATIAPRINSGYIHVGGDETPDWVAHKDYKEFMIKAKSIVEKHGKTMIGWTNDLGSVTNLGSNVVGQHWSIPKTCCETTTSIVKQGGKILMSPASHTYISLKYNETTPFGGHFAGYNDTKNAYLWDPAHIVAGVEEDDVLGIEAALWGERVTKIEDAQFLMYPRLLSLAEVGWSVQQEREWHEFKYRLGAQAPRFKQLGIHYYPSPLVPWTR